MRTFRHILAHLLWIIPLLAWLGVGAYTYFHDNEPVAKGECLKTYVFEHWHKHSPPTQSVHSVYFYQGQAYVVDGSCSDSYISWKDTHKILYTIAIFSILPYALIALLIAAGLIILFYEIFKKIYGK